MFFTQKKSFGEADIVEIEMLIKRITVMPFVQSLGGGDSAHVCELFNCY